MYLFKIKMLWLYIQLVFEKKKESKYNNAW